MLAVAGAGLPGVPAAQTCAAECEVGPAAQTMERVTFEEAMRRAIANHPNVQRAAADIIRADAVLQQIRGRALPSIDGSLTTNVIDPVTRFGGSAIFPRTQTVTTAGVAVPLVTPVRWAERNQAADQVLVSQRGLDEARRQVAVAAGQAYLTVSAQRRVLELNERARDNARAHYEYANQRFQGGLGSRLNAVRAEQEVSSNEARVEEAQLGVRRAQEALGVLMAADGPVDAAADPAFDVPPPSVPDRELVAGREDVRTILARQSAAERRAGDAWKDYLPSVTALFTPEVLAPSGLFANARSWRASVLFTVPLLDSGQRRGQARERQALVDLVRAERTSAERQAGSEIRTAREAVAATERALTHARRAAEQANEVVRITDIAFREGATTNIEVIDAQRRARDAETAAAIAEDAVRRARLELLVATGRFPQ
ncbi:MAG: TolC family protein [Acidobacteria bacterium]|nr:TolC family protein [Acidobacteriota bacterium]